LPPRSRRRPGSESLSRYGRPPTSGQ
jgi:hypothetical protein